MRIPTLGARGLTLLLSLTAVPAAASCYKPARAAFESWKAYAGCEAARLADGCLDRNPRLRRFGPVDLGAAAEGEARAGFERRRSSFHALPEGRRPAALQR